jgi:hypothetical protein
MGSACSVGVQHRSLVTNSDEDRLILIRTARATSRRSDHASVSIRGHQCCRLSRHEPPSIIQLCGRRIRMSDGALCVLKLDPILRPGTSNTAKTQRIIGIGPTVSLFLLTLNLVCNSGFAITQDRWIS